MKRRHTFVFLGTWTICSPISQSVHPKEGRTLDLENLPGIHSYSVGFFFNHNSLYMGSMSQTVNESIFESFTCLGCMEKIRKGILPQTQIQNTWVKREKFGKERVVKMSEQLMMLPDQHQHGTSQARKPERQIPRTRLSALGQRQGNAIGEWAKTGIQGSNEWKRKKTL